MFRIKLAFAVMLCVLTALTVPAAAATPIDQAGWAERKQFVRLPNGVQLAYVEAGDLTGEPLLLLHGYTDTSRSWSLLVPHLAGYRLLIPDQRGHGASDAPECCYSLSQFAFDAKQFLDALGVDRAAVAGHSLGSMIAIHMAAEYPQRVSGVVLVGSTALAPVQPGAWLYDQVRAIQWPLDRNSAFMKEWHPANQPTPVDPQFADAVMGEILAIKPHVWRGVLRELALVPTGRHAADVKAPVLILSGGKDPLFPAEHHRALLAAFPQAQAHVFDQLGHNPNWEQPEDISRRILAFLHRSRN